VNNDVDNCPFNSNGDQADVDNDGIGDVCDSSNNTDTDSDGVIDSNDNCPTVSNADQANQDGDAFGDVCDDDRDGDGVNNDVDNCPVDSNANQFDVDADGIGNTCDPFNPFWFNQGQLNFCRQSDDFAIRADRTIEFRDHFTGLYDAGEIDGQTVTAEYRTISDNTLLGQATATVASSQAMLSIPITPPLTTGADSPDYRVDITLNGASVGRSGSANAERFATFQCQYE